MKAVTVDCSRNYALRNGPMIITQIKTRSFGVIFLFWGRYRVVDTKLARTGHCTGRCLGEGGRRSFFMGSKSSCSYLKKVLEQFRNKTSSENATIILKEHGIFFTFWTMSSGSKPSILIFWIFFTVVKNGYDLKKMRLSIIVANWFSDRNVYDIINLKEPFQGQNQWSL